MSTILEPDQVEYVKSIFNSRELQLIFDIMKEKYAQSWMDSKVDDTQQRDHLYRMVSAVDRLKSELTGAALDSAITSYNEKLKVIPGGYAINKGR